MADVRPRRWRWPSLTTIWGLLAWLLVPLSALAAIGPVDETDVYWHIRMGGDILAHGRFGGAPEWTYGPADLTWATTQPAAEVLLFLVHLGGSWSAVAGFRIVLGALLALSILQALVRAVGARPRFVVDRAVALVGIIVAGAMVPYVQERPQTLSLLILPWISLIVLRVLYADRWPRWWAIGLFVMMWSWFHGAAVLVAPLLLAATLVHALGAAGLKWLPQLVRSLRRGLPAIVATAVAPVLGPLGIGYFAQALRIQEAAEGRIVEWQAPDANNGVLWLALALVGLWALSLVRLAARSGRVWRTFRMDAMVVVGLVLFMTLAGRYLAIGILLLAPLVARRLAQAWYRPTVRVERLKPVVGWIVLAVVSAAALVLVTLSLLHTRPVAADRPLAIWTALAQQDGERRAFVSYNLGGQAELLGDVVVSIDGRSDRYGGRRIDLIRDAQAAKPGWEKTLAEYPGTTDVVIANGSVLLDRLEEQGWREACSDAGYTWLTAPGVSGSCG